MKKILIFKDSFLPGFRGGGPITSIANLVQLLNQDFNILICTKNHDFGETVPYESVESDTVARYKEFNVYYASALNKKSITKVVNEFNPDVIYLNSFFSSTTQKVMLLNKLYFRKKLIVAPRGELQENALNIKKTKKSVYLFVYKFFKMYKDVKFHSTDKIETKRIKELFHTKAVAELQNAVKIDSFSPLTKQKDELKLVFVSRISRKKNLHFALLVLQNTSCSIIFDIYGPKEDMAYWGECEQIIKSMPNNVKISYKGSLAQSEIVKKMREYHAFLFPTLSENFGHVIVEAMQAGLVPIISDQTPWLKLDAINAGWDIKLDDKKKYEEVIDKLYKMENEEYSKKSLAIMKYIHKKLDMKRLSQNYVQFFSKTIER
ncbi:MAG: glycosyltransferase [Candidatus Gracilibacteria bacterium]